MFFHAFRRKVRQPNGSERGFMFAMSVSEHSMSGCRHVSNAAHIPAAGKAGIARLFAVEPQAVADSLNPLLQWLGFDASGITTKELIVLHCAVCGQMTEESYFQHRKEF